ncbi:MAG: WG repeat-containing protein [Bacteroidia bacterium]
MVTEFAFEAADPFWEGFARVSKGGKEFLIAQNGKSFETAFCEDEIKPGVAIDLSVSELKNTPEAVFSVSTSLFQVAGCQSHGICRRTSANSKACSTLQVSVNY